MTKQTEALKLAKEYIGRLVRGLQMDNTSEAAKLLETLDEALAYESSGTEQQNNCRHCGGSNDVICAGQCKEQPAQQQELYVYKPTLPRGNLGLVADGDLPWVYDQDPSSGFSARMLVTPVTSKPAQSQRSVKPWVGLTDDEIINVIHPLVMADMPDQATDYEIARSIEAKLREKNT